MHEKIVLEKEQWNKQVLIYPTPTMTAIKCVVNVNMYIKNQSDDHTKSVKIENGSTVCRSVYGYRALFATGRSDVYNLKYSRHNSFDVSYLRYFNPNYPALRLKKILPKFPRISCISLPLFFNIISIFSLLFLRFPFLYFIPCVQFSAFSLYIFISHWFF